MVLASNCAFAGYLAVFLAISPIVVNGQSPDGLAEFLESPLQDVAASGQAGGDLFTIIFVADSETRMRGNTDEEVTKYISNLLSYSSSKTLYFDHEGGQKHRVDPELVILGGDISVDRGTSIPNDWPLWKQLNDVGVLFIAGFGNHDWESPEWYSLRGDLSNQNTVRFCRQTYNNSATLSPEFFGYTEFGPTDSRGPVTFLATYKGVQIVNFNSFLYVPSYHYDANAHGKTAAQCMEKFWEGCQVYTSAEEQIAKLEKRLSDDAGTPTVVVSHYALNSSDKWWNDYEASTTSVASKKERLKSIVARYNSSVLLDGHEHGYARSDHSVGGKTFSEYTSPYFGGNSDANLNFGGGFIALLVSRTQGIVEVKHVFTPLFDPNYVYTTITTTVTPTTPVSNNVDLSILDGITLEEITPCLTQSCLAQLLDCSGEGGCGEIGAPLVTAKDLTRNAVASIVWDLGKYAETSVIAQELLSCADDNCGTNASAMTWHKVVSTTSAGDAGDTGDAGSTGGTGGTEVSSVPPHDTGDSWDTGETGTSGTTNMVSVDSCRATSMISPVVATALVGTCFA